MSYNAQVSQSSKHPYALVNLPKNAVIKLNTNNLKTVWRSSNLGNTTFDGKMYLTVKDIKKGNELVLSKLKRSIQNEQRTKIKGGRRGITGGINFLKSSQPTGNRPTSQQTPQQQQQQPFSFSTSPSFRRPQRDRKRDMSRSNMKKWFPSPVQRPNFDDSTSESKMLTMPRKRKRSRYFSPEAEYKEDKSYDDDEKLNLSAPAYESMRYAPDDTLLQEEKQKEDFMDEKSIGVEQMGERQYPFSDEKLYTAEELKGFENEYPRLFERYENSPMDSKLLSNVRELTINEFQQLEGMTSAIKPSDRNEQTPFLTPGSNVDIFSRSASLYTPSLRKNNLFSNIDGDGNDTNLPRGLNDSKLSIIEETMEQMTQILNSSMDSPEELAEIINSSKDSPEKGGEFNLINELDNILNSSSETTEDKAKWQELVDEKVSLDDSQYEEKMRQHEEKLSKMRAELAEGRRIYYAQKDRINQYVKIDSPIDVDLRSSQQIYEDDTVLNNFESENDLKNYMEYEIKAANDIAYNFFNKYDPRKTGKEIGVIQQQSLINTFSEVMFNDTSRNFNSWNQTNFKLGTKLFKPASIEQLPYETAKLLSLGLGPGLLKTTYEILKSAYSGKNLQAEEQKFIQDYLPVNAATKTSLEKLMSDLNTWFMSQKEISKRSTISWKRAYKTELENSVALAPKSRQMVNLHLIRANLAKLTMENLQYAREKYRKATNTNVKGSTPLRVRRHTSGNYYTSP